MSKKGRKTDPANRVWATGKTGQARIIHVPRELYMAMLDQRQSFIEKFGKEPRPSDPLFFDPDADTPQPISEEKLRSEVTEALSMAGIDPVKVYAYNKTGILVTEENIHLICDEDLEKWKQAVEEAELMFKSNKA